LKVALPDGLTQASLRWWEAELDRLFPQWLRQAAGHYMLPVSDGTLDDRLREQQRWRVLVAVTLERFDLDHLTYHYVRVS
jgi:hypothetical protein